MRFFTLFACMVCLAPLSYSQGLTGAQQAKADSLLRWIDLQVKQGNTPDPHYIDSVNNVIKTMNASPAETTEAMQGNEIIKEGISGASFTVPEGKEWHVKRMTLNNGGEYNIIVTSVKHGKLKGGEKLKAPTWTAESELLEGEEVDFRYTFTIIETEAEANK